MPITLSPENEELLKEAVSSGHYRDRDEALATALKLLYARDKNGSAEDSVLPPKEWIERFRIWSRKNRQGNPDLDDSRDSMYGDRGE